MRIRHFFWTACPLCFFNDMWASPLDSTVLGSDWLSIEEEYFTLYASLELAEDAGRVQSMIITALSNLSGEFDEFGGIELLEEVQLSFVLYPEPNERVDTGRSVSETSNNVIQISFLSPSRYTAGALNAARQPFDDAAWLHQITHELTTTFAQRATMEKSDGWRYFTAPNWFMQGYEEYISHTYSPGDQESIAILTHNLPRVSLADGDIVIVDPYRQGLSIIQFLHERYGREFAQRLLSDESESFWAAMESYFWLGRSRTCRGVECV